MNLVAVLHTGTGKRRYELTIEDIIKIANYLKTILEKNKEKDNQNVLQNRQQRQ